MKKLFLLSLISVWSISCFAQLTYRLNIEDPDRQSDYAIWKSQDSLPPMTVRVLYSELGPISEVIFYKNSQERFRLNKEDGSWVLRDIASNETLTFDQNIWNNRNGTFTFPDGTVLYRERQSWTEPGLFNRVRANNGELIAVAFHGRELPEAMSQLTVKILEPTLNDELLLAMLAIAIQRRYYDRWLAAGEDW